MFGGVGDVAGVEFALDLGGFGGGVDLVGVVEAAVEEVLDGG